MFLGTLRRIRKGLVNILAANSKHSTTTDHLYSPGLELKRDRGLNLSMFHNLEA